MKPSIFSTNGKSTLIVPTTAGMQFVSTSNISYFVADNIYTTMHLSDSATITVLTSIKILEENICQTEFIRIHKSYLVAIEKIKFYSKSEGGFILLDGNLQIPLSRFRKAEFLIRLGLI